MSFAEIESALAALELRGARAFDREACELVRALIARGQTLPQPVAALLLERARAHLDRLAARFEAVQADTAARLAQLEQIHGPLREQRDALASGELFGVRRTLRRLDQTPVWRRLTRRRELPDPPRGVVEYEAAFADLSAQLVVDRAVEEMPADAGPYNPLRIATDLLARIGAVSPTYLTAQLKRLEELAVMLTLPEPPPPPRPTAPPKKVRAAKPKRRSRKA